jgi:hypothetical protein
MREIEEYNESLTAEGDDKIVYGFQVEKKLNEKQKREAFARGVQESVDMFFVNMKITKIMKVSPLDYDEFDLSPTDNLGEYFKEMIVGFPFRVGIIRSKEVGAMKYKLGIKIIKHVRRQ